MPDRNPTIFGDNRLKLGLFGTNCSCGRVATKAPERWDGTWESNLKLAQMADEAGIECLVPIGLWRGYGGETDFQGATFETIVWACGLLALTRRLTVFGTVHAPLIHPVLAAKQTVTADHIGQGRFGLNIVCGWNEDEFRMFGAHQQAHDDRYEYGQEWWEIIRRLWAGGGPFDFEGKFFQLKGVIGAPRPWGDSSPVMMNAGSSPAGRRFAIRNSDLHFDTTLDVANAGARIRETKALAGQHGHNIQVFTTGTVICRPTRKEAEDYLHYVAVENEDTGAVDRIARLARAGAGTSITPMLPKIARVRLTAGFGGLLAVGAPDDVADEFQRISEAGFDGFAFGMVAFLDEFTYFAGEVLPRLERLGLRRP